MTTRKIHKLFIANRGEIARRVAMGARKLNIASVALYSGNQPHAFLLDAVSELVQVPEENTKLYLDAAEMIDLAKKSGCDAIHPGFGFLSENAAFAASCIKAGLTWVGPSPESIQAMASKAAARELAVKAKVPVVPGIENLQYNPDKPDHKVVEAFATKAGFPILFKATMGGGGKGMRIAHQANEIPDALQRAYSEGLSSFGDGTLIVERYLTKPRHVEVQILGDQHGKVAAIGDRDCSVQRRHQKIIEEAPAPGLNDATRKALHSAATKLAQEVKYYSAGTVEFLVDWSDESRQQAITPFYFLEMNTRLQVEHPVTEEVFGLDLVEWQLRVAQGEHLPNDFVDRPSRGHSIELRVYAEDIKQNFFPAPGPVLAFVPASGPGIRWEVGVDTTDTITPHFDPMIAKLIATGESRPAAINRLVQAIDQTLLAGPKNNLLFLREILTTTTFKDGPVATDFIGRHLESLTRSLNDSTEQAQIQLSGLFGTLANLSSSAGSSGAATEHLHIMEEAFSGPSVAVSRQSAQALQICSEFHSHSPFLPRTRIVYGQAQVQLSKLKTIPIWFVIARAADRTELWLASKGRHIHQIEIRSTATAKMGASKNEGNVTAPVPGKVVTLRVEAGRTVAEGDILMIIESMKMEFEIRAGRGGTIEKIFKAQGDQVTAGDLLIAWKDAKG